MLDFSSDVCLSEVSLLVKYLNEVVNYDDDKNENVNKMLKLCAWKMPIKNKLYIFSGEGESGKSTIPILLFYGSGQNGKSVFIELIKRTIGENNVQIFYDNLPCYNELDIGKLIIVHSNIKLNDYPYYLEIEFKNIFNDSTFIVNDEYVSNFKLFLSQMSLYE